MSKEPWTLTVWYVKISVTCIEHLLCSKYHAETELGKEFKRIIPVQVSCTNVKCQTQQFYMLHEGCYIESLFHLKQTLWNSCIYQPKETIWKPVKMLFLCSAFLIRSTYKLFILQVSKIFGSPTKVIFPKHFSLQFTLFFSSFSE